jgi:hypothetical protein
MQRTDSQGRKIRAREFMNSQTWASHSVNLKRVPQRMSANNYIPPTVKHLTRAKQCLLEDSLAITRSLGANGRPARPPGYRGHKNAGSERATTGRARAETPWAGSPIPQKVYCKAHDYEIVKTPYDDAMPWPHCRKASTVPHARVPHDEGILEMNAELARVVNLCETLPAERRPRMAPALVPATHAVEDRGKLIEDRCAAFENRWWDDGDDDDDGRTPYRRR